MNTQQALKAFQRISMNLYIGNTRQIDVTKLPKVKQLWLIESVIDGEVNYFCEWVKHPSGALIPMICWDTDVRYGWVFIDENFVQKNLEAIKKYAQGRGNYTARLMTMEEYKKLYVKFANVK